MVRVAVYTTASPKESDGLNDAVVPEYETVPGTGDPPTASVNVVPFIVAGFIASLNVASMLKKGLTSTALGKGNVEDTANGTGASPVVKLHAWRAPKGVPVASSTEGVTVTV